MGISYSNHDEDDASREKDEPVQGSNHHTRRDSSKLRKPKHYQILRQRKFSASSAKPTKHAHALPPLPAGHILDMDAAKILVKAQEEVIKEHLKNAKASADILKPLAVDRTRTTRSGTSENPQYANAADYHRQREILHAREKSLAFDYHLETTASEKEQRANDIIQELKREDKKVVYDQAPPFIGHEGQKHARFPGDHFLSNIDLIERTTIFKLARIMPKGAHLHIHFNACLKPEVLLDVAKSMERMFIKSSVPLIGTDPCPFETCEIQFSIIGTGKEKTGNIFSESWRPDQDMAYKSFLAGFPRHMYDPQEWLKSKLTFSADEAHNVHQTALGAWEKFNGRTRMMKGLFNYETAYRTYTRKLLEDFVRDNIQYAEIRPNFMSTNQVWTDDGSKLIDNEGIMKIIINEYDKFQLKSKCCFMGLKIIYCTPRSFSREKVAYALKECLSFKQKWPEWIAGFDLVGEEGQIHPLKEFIPEFLDFRKMCDEAKPHKVEIPFLFHCGETLDIGNDTDENVLDALLLNSKRIGHGFALARHPYIMEHMKKQNVCLELCPISNEILGLTSRVNGHSMYNLLANNVHCTVSSDNGTIFRSTLSHDFYQVMVGKSDMTIHGWRQLIKWSIEHSCMETVLRNKVMAEWLELWDEFLDDIIHRRWDQKLARLESLDGSRL